MTRLKPLLKRRLFKLPVAVFAALTIALGISATTFATPALAATEMSGVDFAWHGDLDPQAFKKAGVDFVVRYIAGGIGGSKEITHSEADMWSKAGVGIVLIWETTASRAGQGYDAGYRDASVAYPQAKSMGMPDGRPVYFAVDYDATGAQVRPYFQGIYDWVRAHHSDGQATSRIGVYGGHDIVKYIHDAGFAAYKWQASAWMHGKGWQSDAMQQYAIDKNVAGVSVDLNRVTTADYGVWFSTCIINPPKKNAGASATKPGASKDGDEAGPQTPAAGAAPSGGALPGPTTTTSQPQAQQQPVQRQRLIEHRDATGQGAP